MPSLSLEAWKTMESKHRSTIQPWLDAFQHRKERGQTHPVHDFLFEYYRCKRKLIIEWHPPQGVVLEDKEAQKFLNSQWYKEDERGVFLDSSTITENGVTRMQWICRLIEVAADRRSQHNCYGLHEWAMVYKETSIRHKGTPLRLSPREIEKVIQTNTIRCTHYDAFRFFTEPAKPLNSTQLEREERPLNEQFGCIHFNMDLFKWCYKLSPWISSELMLDCFFFAAEARELDMRASPYDLSHFGYEPIPIETAEGRSDYQVLQIEIGNKGKALASRLLAECYQIRLQ